MCCPSHIESMGRPSPIVDLNLKAATLVNFGITQPFKGAGLRSPYLMERVHGQLMGEDTGSDGSFGVYAFPAFHDKR